MKIKDALSKFYVKLGGSPTDINADDTSGDILEKIYDVYTDKEGTHVEVKYIECTTGTFDGVRQIVLPEGVTVLSLYDMIDNGVLPIIVCSSTSSDRRFILTSVLTDTYQGTDYVTLSFASSSYGARRKIDGVYTYYIFNNYLITFSSYYDNNKSIDYSTARCNTYPKTVFGGTLTAGNTTLEISDSLIEENCLIDVYTDILGVNPTNIVVVNRKVTLTFEAQASDLNVRIEVSL